MGLLNLGQALAQFDALKRRVGLLASNPSEFAAGSAGPELGNAGPYPGGLLSVMPQVREQAINEALRLTPGLLGATVYHGSPYQFERFDASKIGTGEGAQVYGYGHYVAENPSVAKTYAETLGPQGVVEKAYKANVYKIDLPDEAIAKMLDWDKPLSQQQAQSIAGGLNLAPVNVGHGRYGVAMVGEDGSGRIFPGVGGSTPQEATVNFTDALTARSGQRAYNDIARMLGHERAAEVLQQAGIPGIKYLDQGSRGQGLQAAHDLYPDVFPKPPPPTYNYVVFPGNEGLLKILGRE